MLRTGSKISSSQLNNVETKVDNGGFHLKTNRGNISCYLCSWSISKFSLFKYGKSEGFKGKDFSYCVNISEYEGKVSINIGSFHYSTHHYNCNITISTDLGEVLLHTTLINQEVTVSEYHGTYGNYRNDKTCVSHENLQKLKQLPNDTLVLTCRIMHSGINMTPSTSLNTSVNNSEYLKSLQSDLKKYSNSSPTEKVRLCVGNEAQIVNKTVLCARSPVFTKMFENDTQEIIDNTITITDIKMPVIRALVSFLYSGLIQDCDVDLLSDLYYSADKYQIAELRVACTRLFLSKISLKNIFVVLKLSILHNDEVLKAAIMALISANFETIAMTSQWKNLMHDDPETGLMASTFFDF